jgi:hypothetical protein
MIILITFNPFSFNCVEIDCELNKALNLNSFRMIRILTIDIKKKGMNMDSTVSANAIFLAKLNHFSFVIQEEPFISAKLVSMSDVNKEYE